MVAIIPARGGSKGLPGKNIRMLCGKPLISYTIEAALKSKEIGKVIVTTDSIEIADISKRFGAEVPFMRPEHLASDESSAVDVYTHAAGFMVSQFGYDMSKFVVLLPTSPLRDENDINEAVRIWKKSGATTLVSMCEVDTPASWYYRMNSDCIVENAGFDNRGNAMSNRQAENKYYRPNGAIYILDYDMLKNERTYYSNNTVAYVMSKKKSIDIDTIDDFEYAEYLMNKEKVSKL